MADGQHGALTSEELLTLDDAADYLCVSKPTLYRMLDRGEVKGAKVGRQWRFRKADLTTYLERGPVAVTLTGVDAGVLDAELDFLAGELARLNVDIPLDAEGDSVQESKVALLLARTVRLSLARSASDLHLEAMRGDGDTFGLLRLRVDGVLHEVRRLPVRLHEALVLRTKQLAGIDPAERLPVGDGRLQMHFADGETTMGRVCVMPALFGESLVVHLTPASHAHQIPFDQFGFRPRDLARVDEWLRRSHGVILTSGPTGSGKTTVLYGMLGKVAGPTRKTVSLEDPVEYLLPWVTQVAVTGRAGVTFGSTLRTLLRQDPDVVLVGEVRDLTTLDALLGAAQSGRLVLSQLHVESAFRAPSRIMEVFPADQHDSVVLLMADNLTGVTCQRLVRLLCPHCRQPAEIPEGTLTRIRRQAAEGGYLVPDDAVFQRAIGCEQCGGSGYRGRRAIFELMEFTPTLRAAFLRGAAPEELARLTVEAGGHTLFAEGIRVAAEGITSVEEVLRVLPQ